MYFSLSSALATLTTALTFTAQGTAFIIDIYNSEDCSGDSRSVNVYDNTCASWMGGFASYVPRVYGGAHQYVDFYVPGACAGPTVGGGAWVDGGDGNFKIGQCYYFGTGLVANAASSIYNL